MRRDEYIEKDGQKFYSLMQVDFTNDPHFALGKREMRPGSVMTAMYDKVTGLEIENCLLSFSTNVVLVNLLDREEQLYPNAPGTWIDPLTPRYYFTNSNYD